ncbi:DASH family cryptochrome [Lunatibacter salilacus]|uniref:DASH family cryptochrome n=1 Tax=Lunatibacter salilacus TaxID=2483804 RepID=UPI00131D8A07|nr:DASH family cryptochrome [Lunatibacter salilacus]
MKYKRAIVWFRNDLRLHDNEALTKALQQTDEVIPVYCYDPRSYQKTPFNLEKTGSFRAKFVNESVLDLRGSLQAKAADLVILNGHPEKVMVEFAEQHQVEAIYFSQEVTTEEQTVEKSLEKNSWAKGIATQGYWQATLFHLDDLPFPIPQLPEVFTAFRKGCEKLSIVRQVLPTPDRIPYPTAIGSIGEIPSLEELGRENPVENERSVLSFKGGETQGLQRVAHYLWETDSIAEYKQTRNGLLGANYSSKFSPWLSVGALSPRWIYSEIRNYEKEVEKNDSTYWLIFELIWRDYFRFICKKHGNKIFQLSGIQSDTISWKQDEDAFQAWAAGITGIPFIDANMRELNQTGFMSNRGRQLVASFLTNDLQIDWRWGAAYFESKLIDYDVCSNWGNWMYVAGVGNDPRKDRYFNILLQAKNYDKKGDYVRTWIPELAKLPGFDIHQPESLSEKMRNSKGVHLGDNYPFPIVSFENWS